MVKRNWKILRSVLKGWPCIVHAYFSWIFRYSRHPEKVSLEKRYYKVRQLILKVCKVLRFEWKIDSKVDFASLKPSLIVANHVSLLDPLFLIALSPKPIKFVSKKEARKMPFVGRILRALECVFLDREDPRQALKVFGGAVKEIQDGLCSYCIYPEGKRNNNPYEGEPLPFHAGSLKIAFRSQCPVVLVSSFGEQRIFGSNDAHRSALVNFKVHEPIAFEEYGTSNTQVLAEKLHHQVYEDVSLFRVEDAEYENSDRIKHYGSKWWKFPPFASIKETK